MRFAVTGAKLIAHIPIPAMAGGMLLISWGLVDTRGIRALWRVSRAEFAVMALTCVATLWLELQTAIYAGVLASLFFYLKRTSQPRVQHWREGDEDILQVGGSIFFGASHYLQVRLQRMHGARVVIEAQQEHHGVDYFHEGEEFDYVLSGTVQVTVGEHVNTLGAGDCLHFNSGIPHKLRSISDERAELLVVIYTP